jgi:U3 small nucleolar RNA-associated protein 22
MSLPNLEPMHPLRAAEKLSSSGFGVPSAPKSKTRTSSSQFKPVATPYSLPLPVESTNWKVGFLPPAEITLVGSWATDTSVKGRDGARFGVDVAVEMPSVRRRV